MLTKKNALQLLHGALLLTIGSCVDPYRPPEISSPNQYLVVDGYLNGGTGNSVIRLSRTQNLSVATKPAPETKATVRVEGDGGMAYTFAESSTGTYMLATNTLPVGRTYKVRIKTSNGSEYLSDPVTIRQTPKIDSLSWAVENSGLQVYVNTHDATNKTRYYRWEYEDTYEIMTPYQSPLAFVNNQVVARTGVPINHCWRTQSSTEILVGSTARLTQDVLQKGPLLFIPGSSPKLAIKYSLLVKQYAQSPEGYAYWLNLQKTTEQLGGLFDPLPSQVGGNVHSVTNPAEPVLGFMDGFTVEQVRVFIDRPAALPRNLIRTGYEGCPLDTLPKAGDRLPLSAYLDANGGYNAITYLDELKKYVASSVFCTDCRSLGPNTKPSYWP